MEFQTRFLPFPAQSFFLFGPRGTGKSTWLRRQFPDALFVDLLRPDVYCEMQARPERLHELVLGSPRQATVVVDEVQRVPELLNVVHDLIEQPLSRQFVLTGSSARKLRRGGCCLYRGTGRPAAVVSFARVSPPRQASNQCACQILSV